MTDVTLLQKKVERGQQAEAILRNEAWIAAAEQASKQLSEGFKSDDLDKAMEARNDYRALGRLLSKFKQWQSEGQSAYNQIESLKKRQQDVESMDFNDVQGIV